MKISTLNTIEEMLNDRDKKIKELEEENKKLKHYYDRDKEELMESCYALKKENDELKDTNKNLKLDLAYNRTMLDNVSAEYKSQVNANKNLKKRIKELEQCNINLQEWLDNKEKVNKQLREELEKLKSTYVYDAKQVRDIC